MRKITLLIVAAAWLAVALFIASANAETVRGSPHVIDGDTLAFGEIKVRIAGIDAPEMGQPCADHATGKVLDCGKWSKGFLAKLVAQWSPIECAGVSRDRWGRLIGMCWYNHGEDVGAVQVQEGLAMAYRQYSDAYAADEEMARIEGVGIWETEFIPPWEWRKK